MTGDGTPDEASTTPAAVLALFDNPGGRLDVIEACREAGWSDDRIAWVLDRLFGKA